MPSAELDRRKGRDGHVDDAAGGGGGLEVFAVDDGGVDVQDGGDEHRGLRNGEVWARRI